MKLVLEMRNQYATDQLWQIIKASCAVIGTPGFITKSVSTDACISSILLEWCETILKERRPGLDEYYNAHLDSDLQEKIAESFYKYASGNR